MSSFQGTDVSDPPGQRIGALKRETLESASLILMALAVVLTVSFVGLVLAS
jgi:hypothetical protein